MDILAVQQRFIDAGYQFTEHIFNDGSPNDCWIQFAKDKNPSFLSERVGDCGWGRFSRMSCWRQAAEWLDEQESKG